MMQKRWLSELLAVTLLAGVLCCGVALPAVGTATPATTAQATTVPEGNLLAGLTPFRNTDPNQLRLQEYANLQIISTTALADNAFATSSVANGSTEHEGRLFIYTDYKITWDMGKLYDLTGFLVGSEATRAQWLNSVKIYASDNLSTLYTEDNLAYDGGCNQWQNTVITLGEAVTGRYVGFDFTADPVNGTNGNGWLRMGELGAYGTEFSAASIGGTTSEATTVPADNRLVGLTPFSGTDPTVTRLQEYTNMLEIATTALADNKFATKAVVSGSTTHCGRLFIYTDRRISWDMGKAYNLTGFLVGSEATQAQWLNSVKIYASTDLSTLYTDANLAYDGGCNQWQNTFITLDDTIKAQYVGFDFTADVANGTNGNGYFRMGELGAYGTKVPPTSIGGTASEATTVPADNRLVGLTPFSGTDPTVTRLQEYTNMLEIATTALADNKFATKGVVGGSTTHYGRLFIYTDRKISWDMGKAYNLTGFLVGSEATQAQWLNSVKIYASTDLSTLYTDANLAYDGGCNQWQNTFITLDDTIKAQYVGFDFTADVANGTNGNGYFRMGELGVYGAEAPLDPPQAVQRDGYKMELFTNDAYADMIHTAVAQINLAKGYTPMVYGRVAETGEVDWDTTGNLVDVKNAMIDTIVPGICGCEWDDTHSNNYKGGWANGSNSYLVYDLKGTGTVSQMLLAGPYLTTPDKGYALGQVEVYMSEDKDTLTDPTNLVFNENITVAALVTFTEKQTARYIAMRIVEPGQHDWGRLVELGLYTEDGYPPVAMPNGNGYYLTHYNEFEDEAQTKAVTSVLEQDNVLKLANVRKPAIYKMSDFKAEPKYPTNQGSVDGTSGQIIDSDVAGITSDVNTCRNKVFWDINIGSYMLFDMTMECPNISQVLLAGSYHEYFGYVFETGTWGSWRKNFDLGNCKIYLGNDPATLVSENNLYADADIAVCGLVTFKTPVNARYMAIQFDGGTSGYVRLSEVGVYTSSLLPGLQVENTFTCDTEHGQLNITVERDVADYFDASFLQSIQSVRLVKHDLPDGVNENVEENWFHVADGVYYSLELVDKGGKAITTDLSRRVMATIPNINDEVTTLGLYEDGQVSRLRDALTTADRKSIFLGNDSQNAATVYYDQPIQFVYLTYNSVETVNKLNGKGTGQTPPLYDSNGTPVNK